ncbi:ABC transporter permease [Nonomuraea sp. NPDC050786]|uniref:ABC transporter permease n=1 Tax=Nonomuraea sp. NPDC050786 TaxID=3154840 RepID=UPI0033CB3031
MNWTLALAHTRQLTRDRRAAMGVIGFPLLFLVLAMVGPVGSGDVSRFQLPGALFTALAAIALYGTVLPTAELRRRGTLRLLSTTPLTRRALLFSLAPLRLVLAAAFIVLNCAVSVAYGYLEVSRLPGLVLTSAVGLAFLLALGFVFAAVLTSAETSETVLTILVIAIIFIGDAVVPLSMLPAGVADVLQWLPPALITGALRWELVGMEPPHPEWVTWAIGAGGALLLGALAVRVFRWDDGSSS